MTNIRRLDNMTTYVIDIGCDKAIPQRQYAVTISRSGKDANGNPRFFAIVTKLDSLTFDGFVDSRCYTFTGHYCGEKGEAEYAAQIYDSQID